MSLHRTEPGPCGLKAGGSKEGLLVNGKKKAFSSSYHLKAKPPSPPCFSLSIYVMNKEKAK